MKPFSKNLRLTNFPLFFLRGVSFLYLLLVNLRLWLYQNRFVAVKKSSSYVICVGNITSGGTGKTPIVDAIISFLLKQKIKPAVLTRGYGSKVKEVKIVKAETSVKWEECGDEPYLLAQSHPGVEIYVSPKRAESAEMAEKSHKILIMDDGFQHLRLARDLNLVLLDCVKGLEPTSLLPAGNLREPLSALKRADAIILTKANLGKKQDEILNKITPYPCPVFFSDSNIKSILDQKEQKILPESLKDKKIFLLSGIGNPESFEKLMELNGISFIKHFIFPDHHPFCRNDIVKIMKAKNFDSSCILLVTQKDAVKLKSFDSPVSYFTVQLKTEPEPDFFKFLKSKINLIS